MCGCKNLEYRHQWQDPRDHQSHIDIHHEFRQVILMIQIIELSKVDIKLEGYWDAIYLSMLPIYVSRISWSGNTSCRNLRVTVIGYRKNTCLRGRNISVLGPLVFLTCINRIICSRLCWRRKKRWKSPRDNRFWSHPQNLWLHYSLNKKGEINTTLVCVNSCNVKHAIVTIKYNTLGGIQQIIHEDSNLGVTIYGDIKDSEP